jgi:preprotein translocase subunit SecE
MSNQPVQTVGAAGDKIKIILALLAVIAGVVGFYVLSDKATAVRAGVLVAGLLVAIALGWTSTAGRDLMNFSKEAIRETKKVVWPTRRETLQMTAIVFVFVLVMALFLWSTDKVLEVVLYDLILGWKR